MTRVTTTITLLFMAYLAMGCKVNANNCAKSTDLGGTASAMYARYAEQFLKKGDYKKAQTMAIRAQSVRTDKKTMLTIIKARVKFAESRPGILQQQDIAMLKDDLDIVKQEFPDMITDVKVVEGHIALYLREYGKAEKIYKDVLAKDKDNPFAHFGMGWMLLAQGKKDAAAEEFQAGMKKRPDNYGALLAMGNMSMDKGKYDEAQKYYQKMLDQNPLDIDAAKNVIRTLYMQKKNDKALAILDRLIYLAPKDKQVFMWRAEIMAANKKWKEAIRMANTAMTLGGSLDTAVLLARALIETKQFRKSYNVLSGALKKYNPKDLQLNFLMAVTLENLGYKARALANYKAILASIKNLGPKTAQQLAGVKKTCQDAIERLKNQVTPPKNKKSKK